MFIPVSQDSIMNEFEHILMLFFAGGDGGPNSFTPSHAVVASCSLRNTAVDDGMADGLLGTVICRFHVRLCQKAKVVFGKLGLEPFLEVLGFLMIRRTMSK